MNVPALYPQSRAARNRFVVDRRPPRIRHDPWRHQRVVVEDERAADGSIASVATIFLTGRECPWHCVMCDLWQHTTTDDTPAGALVRQLDDALNGLHTGGAFPTHVKLYNAGNFFDPRAVPESDYDAIAARVARFTHVVVESHPVLVGERLDRFADALTRAATNAVTPSLEVAMGLETSHPQALERLNKGFTLEQFAAAAERIRSRGAAMRAFVLVGVPFIASSMQQEWTARSASFAFDCGASVVSLIPLRTGNGALEALGVTEPTLRDLEAALEGALVDRRGRVFADLWDLERFAACASCYGDRMNRLRRINLEQRSEPSIRCAACGAAEDRIA
jgi:archaeosine synthase beta-subunit